MWFCEFLIAYISVVLGGGCLCMFGLCLFAVVCLFVFVCCVFVVVL